MEDIAPKAVYLYALLDPRDDMIRYIGVSISPRNRYRSHVSESLRKVPLTSKQRWISGLIDQEMLPKLRILSETTADQADDLERRAIVAHIFAGADLLNSIVGDRSKIILDTEHE